MLYNPKDRSIKPKTVLRDFLAREPDFFGDVIFIDFIHKCFSITHYPLSMDRIIFLCGYCISFLVIWYEVI